MSFFTEVFGKILLRYVVTGLAILGMVILISRCDTPGEKKASLKLEGTWETKEYLSEEKTIELFDGYGFDEEEIAVIDTRDFCAIKKVSFSDSGKYSFYYDVEETKEHLRTCFEEVFHTLYINRAKLASVYGDISEMTEWEFQTNYAISSGFWSYEVMIDRLAVDAFNYQSLALGSESGEFDVKNGRIIFRQNGKGSKESVGYSLNEDQLILTYGNGKEEYVRVRNSSD